MTKKIITISIEPEQFEFAKRKKEFYNISMSKIIRLALSFYMQDDFKQRTDKINKRYGKLP